MLENVDRHLGERKERSEGIQCAEGPERRRRRRKAEEEGELKRRGGDETGRRGPVRGERGRERQIRRSTDSSGVQSAACRLAIDAAVGLNTHMHRHTHP